jgi:hypothetical protein
MTAHFSEPCEIERAKPCPSFPPSPFGMLPLHPLFAHAGTPPYSTLIPSPLDTSIAVCRHRLRGETTARTVLALPVMRPNQPPPPRMVFRY